MSLRMTVNAKTASFFLPYGCVALVYLVALLLGAHTVVVVTRPLLMPLLLLAFLCTVPRLNDEIAVLGSLALVFSWCADVSLQFSGTVAFVTGHGFFFLAIGSYLVLFIRKLGIRRLPVWTLVYVVWWVVFVMALVPYTGTLIVPVALYLLMLGATAMTGAECHRYISAGTSLLVVSNSLVALAAFIPGGSFAGSEALVALTYVCAQLFIVWGMARTSRSRRRRRQARAESPAARRAEPAVKHPGRH